MHGAARVGGVATVAVVVQRGWSVCSVEEYGGAVRLGGAVGLCGWAVRLDCAVGRERRLPKKGRLQSSCNSSPPVNKYFYQ